MRDFTSSPFFISFLFGFSICIFTFWNIQISFCWHIQTVRLIDREIVIDKNKFLGDSIPILYLSTPLPFFRGKSSLVIVLTVSSVISSCPMHNTACPINRSIFYFYGFGIIQSDNNRNPTFNITTQQHIEI